MKATPLPPTPLQLLVVNAMMIPYTPRGISAAKIH